MPGTVSGHEDYRHIKLLHQAGRTQLRGRQRPLDLELLDRAPDPDRAARLSRTSIVAALGRAGHRDIDNKATERFTGGQVVEGPQRGREELRSADRSRSTCRLPSQTRL
jgi:hypothetical protein